MSWQAQTPRQAHTHTDTHQLLHLVSFGFQKFWGCCPHLVLCTLQVFLNWIVMFDFQTHKAMPCFHHTSSANRFHAVWVAVYSQVFCVRCFKVRTSLLVSFLKRMRSSQSTPWGQLQIWPWATAITWCPNVLVFMAHRSWQRHRISPRMWMLQPSCGRSLKRSLGRISRSSRQGKLQVWSRSPFLRFASVGSRQNNA